MKRKTLIICISVCLMILALQTPVLGGNLVKIWKLEIADPVDPGDDYARPVPLRWQDEDMPVMIALYRDIVGDVIPYNMNTHNIQGYEVLQAVNRSIKRMNEVEFSYFEFMENAVFSDFLIGINPWYPFGPVGLALDRFNLITYQDPVVTFPAGVISLTSWFYFTQDFDATAQPGIPVDVINGLIMVNIDIDGDGFIDVYLPRRKYKAGTIIDSDIVMNQFINDWRLAPENPPSGADYADWLGVYDIESIMQHEMGHMVGVGHSYLYMASWTGRGHRGPGSNYPTDPWAFRELDFDDKMTLGLAYPSKAFKRTGGIAGEVLDGNSPTVTGIGDPQVDAPVVMAPVFVGVPNLNGRLDLDTVQSDRGPIKLIAQVYTCLLYTS
ncbi:MAG: hypothetical protein N2246_05275, partial [Candidatus Sumerlaeia bacterium]|nr:hypothetical protein [Candidatus Sumerlaeia bacterium]